MNPKVMPMGLMAVIALGTGCATTGDSVREEKLDTVEEHADMHAATADETRQAHVAHAERVAEVRKAEAEQEAQEGLREDISDIEMEEKRGTYKADVRNRIAKIGIRLNEAKRKAEIKDVAEDPLLDNIEDARQVREEIREDIDQLDRVDRAEWDKARAKMDERLSTLEERVEALNSRVDAA